MRARAGSSSTLDSRLRLQLAREELALSLLPNPEDAPLLLTPQPDDARYYFLYFFLFFSFFRSSLGFLDFPRLSLRER